MLSVVWTVGSVFLLASVLLAVCESAMLPRPVRVRPQRPQRPQRRQRRR
jgi:hypothetical protein